MDWFLYDNGLRLERVKFAYYQKQNLTPIPRSKSSLDVYLKLQAIFWVSGSGGSVFCMTLVSIF